MSLLGRIPFSGKFLVSPAIGVVLTMALVWIFLVGERTHRERMEEIAGPEARAVESISNLSLRLSTNHAAIYELLMSREADRDEQRVFESGRPLLFEIHRIEAELSELGPGWGPRVEERVGGKSIVENIASYRTHASNGLFSSAVSAVTARQQMAQATHYFNAANAQIIGMIRQHESHLRQLAEAAQEESRARTFRFSVVAGLAVGFTVLMSFALSRILSRDVRGMIAALSQLAGGDTTVPIPRVASSDEMGEMARGLEAFRDSVRSLRLRQRAIESSPIGIAFAENDTPATAISYANDAFAQIVGRPAEALVGEPLASVLGPDADPRQREALRTAVEQGRELELSLEFGEGGSAQRFAEFQLTTLPGNGHYVVHHVATLTDVTERRELESQLLHSQKMEAIGQLAAGVAHDFNNYLSIILGNAEALERTLREAGLDPTNATEIMDGVRMSASLTRQLLTFGRKQVMNPRVLDLNSVIQSTEKLLSRVLGEHIQLETHCAPDLARVTVDESQFEQIVTNLAVNARDAMPDGGTLTLETANVELDAETVGRLGGSRPGLHVVLRVTDAGVGMDEATASRIFEPFYTTKGPGRGSGLGLATVDGIVRQSDGFITVSSRPGNGTRFEIFIPATTRPVTRTRAEARAPAGEAAPRRHGGTILLVEDEDAVRSVIRRMLQVEGFRVVEAAGGEAALALAMQEPIDLLLTDLVMPDMGGVELVERLAALRPGLPVVYLSGYAEDEVMEAVHRAPSAGFVAKPFTAMELLEAILLALDPPQDASDERG